MISNPKATATVRRGQPASIPIVGTVVGATAVDAARRQRNSRELPVLFAPDSVGEYDSAVYPRIRPPKPTAGSIDH
jgi:hypothetical protein